MTTRCTRSRGQHSPSPPPPSSPPFLPQITLPALLWNHNPSASNTAASQHRACARPQSERTASGPRGTPRVFHRHGGGGRGRGTGGKEETGKYPPSKFRAVPVGPGNQTAIFSATIRGEGKPKQVESRVRALCTERGTVQGKRGGSPAFVCSQRIGTDQERAGIDREHHPKHVRRHGHSLETSSGWLDATIFGDNCLVIPTNLQFPSRSLCDSSGDLLNEYPLIIGLFLGLVPE